MARTVARRLRRRPAPSDGEERHASSATAVAAEAMRTGVVPARSLARVREEIPREDVLLRAGDPDDSGLLNEYAGEDVPGGSTPTPDQNQVDEIGRVYGVQDEDAGELHTSAELLARRDRRRQELRAPRRAR